MSESEKDPTPRIKSLEVSLLDGTPVLIRPVTPEDKHFFIEGFELLSKQSRYLRFMRPLKVLSERDLKFFTEIDHVNHMAWGALCPSPEGDQGVGVARYVRNPENPREAEAAVTIIDAFQHRGIGTLLAGALYWSALENGIESFVGYVLAENQHMLRLLRILNAEMKPEGHGVIRVRVSVIKDVETVPDSRVGQVLKQTVKALSE